MFFQTLHDKKYDLSKQLLENVKNFYPYDAVLTFIKYFPEKALNEFSPSILDWIANISIKVQDNKKFKTLISFLHEREELRLILSLVSAWQKTREIFFFLNFLKFDFNF